MKAKQLFIIILSILAVVFTSCSNDSTKPKVLYRVSDIVGDWISVDTTEKFTISADGYIYLTTNSGTTRTYISGWDINGEILEGEELLKFYFTVTLTAQAGGGVGTVVLTFNSASNCTATLLGKMATFTKL
ncbi:hypothetical protein EPJ64_10310 [Brachyspira aalborgi]|jgi:hypothetical protein|uniref:Lipocalin-like domain-containing protein n=1 Tax=Brachyspira aalborgi TaxID=29522 RepID=A0AB38PVJ5_9SPIR|nr:hypothetical protein [Brachyspira aalborgi]MBS4764143.1 hypothetical protein [Brachyspira sp.]CCY78256.1 unknown [Brachyspira sp. CAG:700]TXJ15071.1 hypothetical protein EPJ77_07910 [Brachyspira aalborgi]TXJ18293.1 hypothetical protein EPJ64_10310 [Brachyspira aalborgi]TXJ24251.1 hypothetical protein EPJ73_10410 [Brachyspira aalborgi]